MSYYGPQYTAYGATPAYQMEAGAAEKPKPSVVLPKTRTRINLGTVCTSLFFPWILFTLASTALSFVQYDYPTTCYIIVFLVFFVALAVVAYALTRLEDLSSSNPTSAWLVFLAATSLAAVILGTLTAQLNYSKNLQPYYDLNVLNVYRNVDPRTMKGQSLMDAGKVHFVEGATVDVWKAHSFTNNEQYCVAPVSVKDKTKNDAPVPLQYYDFWAVGLGCCGGNMTSHVNYRCGPLKNSTAHHGVRMMSARQRDFFRLAVQQSEAVHKIKARYPIFFYWSTDAEADVSSYRDTGLQYYVYGVAAQFALQAIFFMLASFVISHVFSY
jgi:hypothetical protein